MQQRLSNLTTSRSRPTEVPDQKPLLCFADPAQGDVRKLSLTKTVVSFCRSLDLASQLTAAVESSETAAMGRSLRALARSKSDPAEPDRDREKNQQERAKCWKAATAARKKLCSFHLWKAEPDLAQQTVNSLKYQPDPGARNRLFDLSCDLFDERWATPNPLGLEFRA